MSPDFAAPPSDLSGFPGREFTGALFRIHGDGHHPGYFSSTGSGRFDLVSVADVGTCYVASTEAGAFVEVFGDLRVVPASLVDSKRISQASVNEKLRLADVTDPHVIGQYGLGQEMSANLDYAPTQEWAHAFYAGGFDGIWYSSRHDPAGESRSVAIFGHAPVDELRLVWSTPVPIVPRLLDEVAARFGIEVFPTV